MPMFATGNPGWDQGLNTLAGSLFPDPSKQAQAGYYGAETAKAIIDAQAKAYQQKHLEGLPMTAAGWLGLSTPPGAAAAPPAPDPSLANTVAPPSAPGAPPAMAAPPGTPPAVAPPAPGASPAVAPTQPPPGPVALQNGAPIDLTGAITEAVRAGIPPAVIPHIAGAVLNGLVTSGKMSPGQANEILARVGDNAPFESTQATQRTGITAQASRDVAGINAGSAANVARIQGQNTIANTRLTTEPSVDAAGNKIYTNVGAIADAVTAGQPVPGYDPARALQGDTPVPVAGATPNAPPQIVQQRNAPGRSPASEAELIKVTPTAGGSAVLLPRGVVRAAPPGTYREENAVDSQPAVVAVPGKPNPINTTTSQTYAPGAQATPLPTGTDQATGRALGEIVTQATTGHPDVASAVTEAMQSATQQVAPKQNITPEQNAQMEQASADHFANMYQPESGGMSLGSYVRAPAVPDPAGIGAFHDNVTRQLMTTGGYRNNPAAAGPVAWELMRQAGMLNTPKEVADLRQTRVSMSGQHANLVGPDDNQRLVLQGHMENADKFAFPGGGPRIAPMTTPTQQARGPSLGAAAPGAPDGATATDRTTGRRFVVYGGQLYAAPGGTP